jgi:hypothetical protein
VSFCTIHALMDNLSFHYFSSKMCPFCGKTKANLSSHIKLVHEKVKNFWCGICGYGAFAKNVFSDHMISHLPKNVKCHLCAYTTHTEKLLKVHQKNAHGLPNGTAAIEGGKCPECNRLFKDKGHIPAHILRKHKMIRDFKCVDCDKAFVSKSDLS